MKYSIGDRVRSLVNLDAGHSICGETECKDLVIGSVGTVDHVFTSGGYGVLFDDDFHQMSCYMDATDIEAAR